MSNGPLNCEIRYRLDQSRMAEFRDYARTWTALINRHGGTHHGFFLPREKPETAAPSFPGLGKDAGGDIAVAIFTFPSEAAYLAYRRNVAEDPDGMAANARFADDPPFASYERLFLEPLVPE